MSGLKCVSFVLCWILKIIRYVTLIYTKHKEIISIDSKKMKHETDIQRQVRVGSNVIINDCNELYQNHYFIQNYNPVVS